ncbi:hypothetical protein ACFQPA_00800 [Halomarina halobia]|uniref:Uncharacterized protein n=1 Tax=Halomarina halobia TaxID=3033386 RepID=A0ABD6A7H0_9EURY|nr:hypothetical protein [Halomarina sp. PSR21]
MSLASTRRFDRLPADLRWLAPLVLAEALLLVGYFGVTDARPTTLRYVLYPFVWIDVGLWAAVRTAPRPAGRHRRWAAALVAVAYFLVLAWLAGLIGAYPGGHGHAHAHVHGWQFVPSAPGWGPRIAYAGHAFHVAFVPYQVLAYLVLAYLVYARALDASAAALPGAVGLLSCIGCSFPIVASIAATALGTSSGLTTAATAISLDLSTAAFVLAVALLYWVPRRGWGGS